MLEYDGGLCSDEDRLNTAVKLAEQAVTEAERDHEEKMHRKHWTTSSMIENPISRRRTDQNWAKVNQRALRMNTDADFEVYKAQNARGERSSTACCRQVQSPCEV